MLAHAVLVWCGVRATGLTTGQPTTGQVQVKCRTSAGQVQDNYRTTTGHCSTVKPALRTRLRRLSCPSSDELLLSYDSVVLCPWFCSVVVSK